MLSRSRARLRESASLRGASETSQAPKDCASDCQLSSSDPRRGCGPSRFFPPPRCEDRESRAAVASRHAPSVDAEQQMPRSATETRRKVLCPSPVPFSQKCLRKDRGSGECCRALSETAPLRTHQYRKFLCRCRNPLEKDPGTRPTRQMHKGQYRWVPKKLFGIVTLLVSSAGTKKLAAAPARNHQSPVRLRG